MSGVLRVLVIQVLIVVLIGAFVAVCAHFFVAGIQYFEILRGQQSHLLDLFGLQVNVVTAGLLLRCLSGSDAGAKSWSDAEMGKPSRYYLFRQNRQRRHGAKKGAIDHLCFFHFSGWRASLGQYGPLVHLGAPIGIAVAKGYHQPGLGVMC